MTTYKETITETAILTDSVKIEVIAKINASIEIPPDAKASIIEFIEDSKEDITQHLFDKLPPELIDHLDLLVSFLS